MNPRLRPRPDGRVITIGVGAVRKTAISGDARRPSGQSRRSFGLEGNGIGPVPDPGFHELKRLGGEGIARRDGKAAQHRAAQNATVRPFNRRILVVAMRAAAMTAENLHGGAVRDSCAGRSRQNAESQLKKGQTSR